MSYEEVFQHLSGFAPYPFQVEFHKNHSDLKVLEVPTGLGKTYTVIVDWIEMRPTTRLVYCLPGRALTQQVVGIARSIASKVGNLKVVELMGGSEDLDLKIAPEEPTILVGTQDILVSRALNRGYAQSPFRWPMDFGLLNNDVTWIFDEVQLLGEAVATGVQLAAFRKQMGTFGKARCVWMTATFERSWLNTVDFHGQPDVIRLMDKDLAEEFVQKRVYAKKTIEETKACDTPRQCAEFVQQGHQVDQLTVVIANTVARAQEIWIELKKMGVDDAVLLHSRFRPCDREGIVESVLEMKRGVIVSTQVIEAGVDLDAHLMITDVAPWASLVQRFGRVNRRGEHEDARIFWVRSPQRQKGKVKTDGSQYRPYEPDEVEQAIGVLEGISSASPNELSGKVKAPVPYRYVLRRSDLMDLFDTTPDLAGNQIDISRFVRSGDETSIYLAWRSWPKEDSPPRRKFARQELCPVPHFPGGNEELKKFLKANGGWTWNYSKTGRWEKLDPERLYAGMRILLRAEAGGYDPMRGWAPDSKEAVPEFLAYDRREEPSMDSDQTSETITQSLEEHSDEVVQQLKAELASLRFSFNGCAPILERAARLHDWGKAHEVFQQTLHLEDLQGKAPAPLLAKQAPKQSRHRHSRVGFRHELASALAMLSTGEEFLASYLVAAHHGKVRSNIRSIDGEVSSKGQGSRIARGVEDGDSLFPANLGGGIDVPDCPLSLEATELGAQGDRLSWSDQVSGLLKEYGPFRLAYLELLLRTADEKASAKAAGRTR